MKPNNEKQRKTRITHASAKAKARNLQNWAAKRISELTSLPWGKDTNIAPRPMGQSGVDIALLGNAFEACPLSIECKNQETWAVPAWITQAKKNQLDDSHWCLIIKRNHLSPVAIIDADALLRLVTQAMSCKECCSLSENCYPDRSEGNPF